MNLRRKLTHRFLGIISLLALLSCTDRIAGATEPSGVTATVLNRATVPEFEARRKYRQKCDHRNRGRGKHWKIELEATRTIDVVTVLFTVQPGGHSGWHTHPGPAIFTVSKGTLTMYEADDPSCRPQLFPAGTGSIEADTAAHHHMLRNETDEVAETIVTFLLPVGALLRTDLPDPGQCPF
jgi:hypothetical protein